MESRHAQTRMWHLRHCFHFSLRPAATGPASGGLAEEASKNLAGEASNRVVQSEKSELNTATRRIRDKVRRVGFLFGIIISIVLRVFWANENAQTRQLRAFRVAELQVAAFAIDRPCSAPPDRSITTGVETMTPLAGSTRCDPFLGKQSLSVLAKMGFSEREPRLGPHRHHGVAARTRLCVAGKVSRPVGREAFHG